MLCHQGRGKLMSVPEEMKVWKKEAGGLYAFTRFVGMGKMKKTLEKHDCQSKGENVRLVTFVQYKGEVTIIMVVFCCV